MVEKDICKLMLRSCATQTNYLITVIVLYVNMNDTILWPCGVGTNAALIALKIRAIGGSPQIMISAPSDGSTTTSTSVNVSVQVKNLNQTNKIRKANVTGEGHIYYYRDVLAPTAPARPATTKAGTNAASPNTSYNWTDLTPGLHTFSAELVNNDNTPVIPAVMDTINVTVESRPIVPTAHTTICL